MKLISSIWGELDGEIKNEFVQNANMYVHFLYTVSSQYAMIIFFFFSLGMNATFLEEELGISFFPGTMVFNCPWTYILVYSFTLHFSDYHAQALHETAFFFNFS